MHGWLVSLFTTFIVLCSDPNAAELYYEKSQCVADRDAVCTKCQKCNATEVEIEQCTKDRDTVCIATNQMISATLNFSDGSARAIYGMGAAHFEEAIIPAVLNVLGLDATDSSRFTPPVVTLVGDTVSAKFTVLPPRELWCVLVHPLCRGVRLHV